MASTRKGRKEAKELIAEIEAAAEEMYPGLDGLNPGTRAGSGTNTLPVSNSLPAGMGIGNRGAPKRGESFTEIMLRELEKPLNVLLSGLDPQTSTAREAIVHQFVKEATKGNMQAFIELMNRTEGKVPDKLLQATASIQVVPWDDDQAPAVFFKQNPGHGEKSLEKPTPDDLIHSGEPAVAEALGLERPTDD